MCNYRICTAYAMMSTVRGVALKSTLWDVGQDITISMLRPPSEKLVQEIKHVSELWLNYANLNFIWLAHNDTTAQIRIAFNPKSSWSYIGTINKHIGLPQPTMNFGWLEDWMDRDTLVLTSVVLHEFGHMLGLGHEQSHPNHQIPWNKQAVYDYYINVLGWTKSMVDYNVLFTYREEDVIQTSYDTMSIMHYSIDNRFTHGNYSVDWTTELSDGDKNFINTLYPFPEENDIYLPTISR